jgi:hypothetical protein
VKMFCKENAIRERESPSMLTTPFGTNQSTKTYLFL